MLTAALPPLRLVLDVRDEAHQKHGGCDGKGNDGYDPVLPSQPSKLAQGLNELMRSALPGFGKRLIVGEHVVPDHVDHISKGRRDDRHDRFHQANSVPASARCPDHWRSRLFVHVGCFGHAA